MSTKKEKAKKEKIDVKIKDRPFTLRYYRMRARWLLGIGAVIFLMFFSFFDRMLLPIDYPEVGSPAPKTIRAPYDVSFNVQEAYRQASQEAIESFVPIFDQESEVQKRVEDRIRNLLDEIKKIQQASGRSPGKKIERLRGLFPSSTSEKELGGLLRLESVDELKELILSELVHPILSKGIIADKEALSRQDIRIRHPFNTQIEELPLQEIYSPAEAKKSLEERAKKLLFNLDDKIVALLMRKIGNYLAPNLIYSQENLEELKNIRKIPSDGLRLYRRGDILLQRGEVVTRMDIHCLKAANAEKVLPYWLTALGSFIPYMLLTLLFIAYLAYFHSSTFSNVYNYAFIFLIILITMVVAKAILLFSPFPVLGYCIPIAMVGMLVTSLMNRRIALVTTLMAAAYLTFLTNFRMTFFLFYVVEGILGIWAGTKAHKRGSLFLFSLLIGLVNGVIFFCGQVMEDTLVPGWPLVYTGIEAFSGGILAWVLTLLVTPFFEKVFDVASTYRLLELSDLNSPLLKKLAEKASGTFYHCLAVGNLAAAAAEAIGANSLLARVGSYYHDLGKMLRPPYFVENQTGGENPHEALTPAMSSHILRSHVREGIEIAKSYDLPQLVIDMIPQHHGTSVMSFFYHKAQHNGKEKDVALSEEFFRYEGPKPLSVEAAILMISDSVEATSRVLKNPSYLRVEEMVKEIVHNKFTDGQFDECPITVKELNKIIHALTNCLVGSSHHRIEYPKEKEKEKEKEKAEVESPMS